MSREPPAPAPRWFRNEMCLDALWEEPHLALSCHIFLLLGLRVETVGETIRDCPPGHAVNDGPHLTITGASRGFSWAAVPVWGFSIFPQTRRLCLPRCPLSNVAGGTVILTRQTSKPHNYPDAILYFKTVYPWTFSELWKILLFSGLSYGGWKGTRKPWVRFQNSTTIWVLHGKYC